MKNLTICSAIGLLIAAGFIGYKSYKTHRQSLCTSWMQQAIEAEANQYHARAIDILTIYFSEDVCRGKSDPTAIKILTLARPHVPLPGGEELTQQLSLSRLGWQLERDPSFQLTQAKAALALRDWKAASELAGYASGTQADFIKITAAVRLKDWRKLQQTLDALDISEASEFQYALLTEMLQSAPVKLPDHRPDPLLCKLAKSILRGGDDELISMAATVKLLLNNNDLAIAVNMLSASKNSKAIIALLDQPDRVLPASLLKKLAYQYWATSDRSELITFATRKTAEALPGETLLLICLAKRELQQGCTVTFDDADYAERYGKYSANYWKNLFQLLEAPGAPAHEIVDALVRMEDLIRKEPVTYQLLAALYSELGEDRLAKRYEQTASLFGLAPTGSWHRVDVPSWITQLHTGYLPTEDEVVSLEAISPKQSTLWRLARSRLTLSRGNDSGAAEALRTIRPVLGWAPEIASAQLIAASGTAHFGDHDASYGHLMNAVKADPKSAVAALRLSLHFYKQQNGLTATELTHWWETLTRAEVRNDTPEKARNLIVERAMILAAVAEEYQDQNLAQNAYRTVLKEQPDNHVALNNLAVWLSKDKATLFVAKKMAEAAIVSMPGEGEYRATLQDIETAIESGRVAGAL